MIILQWSHAKPLLCPSPQSPTWPTWASCTGTTGWSRRPSPWSWTTATSCIALSAGRGENEDFWRTSRELYLPLKYCLFIFYLWNRGTFLSFFFSSKKCLSSSSAMVSDNALWSGEEGKGEGERRKQCFLSSWKDEYACKLPTVALCR